MNRLAPFGTVLLVAASFGQPGQTSFRMMIPGVAGALELDPGPASVLQRIRSDGKEVQMRGIDERTGLNSSAFLQRVSFKPSSEECRKQWWGSTQESTRFKRSNVRLSNSNGMARVDYDVAEFDGRTVNQHSAHVYLGGGSVCAEVHLSKLHYTPADEALFTALLGTVKLLPDAPPIASSLQLVATASALYERKDYKQAARIYQQALDDEKQVRGLNADFFKVLIDNLGMSYGISGDLERAKDVFEYGVTQYPDYPLFHYNLACDYGEQGDESSALQELRLAYARRANMIAGETFPNPLTDDSFTKFVSDKRFVEAVQAMGSSQQ